MTVPLWMAFSDSDGVELLDHLGQAPGAQAGEEHHAQQVQGVGAEEGGEDAGDGAGDGRGR